MEKLKMHSPDLTQANIEQLMALFPNCVTEARDENGNLKKAVDFDLLKQELSDSLVEGNEERYHLNWPGKRKALLTANMPIAKTLRPCIVESVHFETTKNLFIEGDNLDALKLLQENYLGKVKMIYIDPPYNTGGDFIYEDDFAESTEDYLAKSNQKDEEGNRLQANLESEGKFHSNWLSMMYPRLKLARNLLRDDGVMFISIDEHEIENIKKLGVEIFGQSNLVGNVIWQRAFAPKNDAKYFSDSHDYIVVFAKNKSRFDIGLLERSEEANNRYKNPDNDPRGAWTSGDLTVKTYSASNDYIITAPSGRESSPAHGSCWRVSKAKFDELEKDNRIWFGVNGDNVPRLKRFLSEVQDGMVPVSLWLHEEVGHNQEARQELKKLFDDKGFFDGPKPIRLLSKILKIANLKKDDIILDFYSGSATTAHAVMQFNAEDDGKRQFIMVQLPEKTDEKSEAHKAGYKTIAEISKERIRRAGKKIKEENADKEGIEDLDVGFRVLKVDTSNMNDVHYNPDTLDQNQLDLLTDNIKDDRSEEDLLFQVLLDWGVELDYPITTEIIDGKTVYFVDEDTLVACFDKEQGITEDFVKTLAERKPQRVVFRDAGFKDDSMKTNTEQIFKLLSPNTDIKTL